MGPFLLVFLPIICGGMKLSDFDVCATQPSQPICRAARHVLRKLVDKLFPLGPSWWSLMQPLKVSPERSSSAVPSAGGAGQGLAGAASHCARLSAAYIRFCAADGPEDPQRQLFCRSYAAQCGRRPNFQENQGFELIEEEPISPDGAIAQACARFDEVGRHFCVGSAAVPPEYEGQCEQFRRFCLGRGGGGGQGATNQERQPARVENRQLGDVLSERCAEYRGAGERFCIGANKLEAKYENFCEGYRKYCARPRQEPGDLRRIADIYNGDVAVDDNTNINGIPFYPFNPEGAIGVGDGTAVDFGSWGGGIRRGQSVTDFWENILDAGGNWHNGWYGGRTRFGVPMFGGVFSGTNGVSVHVPINENEFGDPIAVNNKVINFGQFIDIGKSIGVDWFGGGVSAVDQVSVPFVGVSSETGTRVKFPSVGAIVGSLPFGADREVQSSLAQGAQGKRIAQAEAAGLPPPDS